MRTLYRYFDSSDKLLYVGATRNPIARISAHLSDKKWFIRVATARFIHYDNDQEALALERKAIREENPAFNVKNGNAKNQLWTGCGAKCKVSKCEGASALRGLCRTHYYSVAQLVCRGATTWTQLERNGKVNKQGKRGPKTGNNPFLT